MGRVIYYAIDNQALSMLDIGQKEMPEEEEDAKVKMEGMYSETQDPKRPYYKSEKY